MDWKAVKTEGIEFAILRCGYGQDQTDQDDSRWEDYSAACEIYRKIVEEPQDGGKFLSTIVNAGLTSPYDEQTYVKLQKLAET